MKPSKRSLLFAVPGIAILTLSLCADALGIGGSNGIGSVQIIAVCAGVLSILVGLAISRRAHPSNNHLSTKKKLLFLSFCIGCVTLPLLVTVVLYKSHLLYASVSSRQSRGWKGTPHRDDPALGYTAIANGEGSETFSIGPEIPIRYSAEGFRIPRQAALKDRHRHGPVILFLGCSFTYGAACLAEETFAERVGQATDGTPLNAGKCSYGLSQMVLLARQLVPELKPDYVVVQYSPWLVDRAMNPFMPSRFGKLPGPYYSNEKNGEIRIQPPVFSTKLFDLPIDEFRGNTDQGFLSFVCRVGAPLYMNDLWNMTLHRARCIINVAPKPATDREGVIRTAYEDMSSVCQEQDARMVVLILGNSMNRIEIPKGLRTSEVQLVDAQQALIDRLKISQQYGRVYKHWRGTPAKQVDGHPNAHAHAIIAETLVRAIQNNR